MPSVSIPDFIQKSPIEKKVFPADMNHSIELVAHKQKDDRQEGNNDQNYAIMPLRLPNEITNSTSSCENCSVAFWRMEDGI